MPWFRDTFICISICKGCAAASLSKNVTHACTDAEGKEELRKMQHACLHGTHIAQDRDELNGSKHLESANALHWISTILERPLDSSSGCLRMWWMVDLTWEAVLAAAAELVPAAPVAAPVAVAKDALTAPPTLTATVAAQHM